MTGTVSAMRKLPTFADVNAILRVQGPHLIWRIRRGGVDAGQRAGTVKKDGYIGLKVAGRDLSAHRITWLLSHGEWPADEIDHINGDRADNRIENLRLATKKQNAQNRMSVGASVFKGVTLHKCGKYQVTCGKKYIGLFSDAESAAKAYDAEARRLFGVFARTNFEAEQA